MISTFDSHIKWSENLDEESKSVLISMFCFVLEHETALSFYQEKGISLAEFEYLNERLNSGRSYLDLLAEEAHDVKKVKIEIKKIIEISLSR